MSGVSLGEVFEHADGLLRGLLTEALASLREDDVGCPPWDTQCDKYMSRRCTRHALVDRIEEALYPSEEKPRWHRVAKVGFFFCGRCGTEVPRAEAVHGVDFVAICSACNP